MPYGKTLIQNSAIWYCFILSYINKNKAISAVPCSEKHYPATLGEFSSHFYLTIQTMELKKDLFLKTPLPTATSGHCRSPRSKSAVKQEEKIANDAWALQKPCMSSCISAGRLIQMEGGRPRGILSKNLNS